MRDFLSSSRPKYPLLQHTPAMRLLWVLAAAISLAAAERIDRKAVVSRHDVRLAHDAVDPDRTSHDALSVGNGDFAFTADLESEGEDIALEIDWANGTNWNVSVGGVAWLRSSGQLRFFCESKWQSMRETSRKEWGGTANDGIGPYNATSIRWQADTSSLCVLNTTFKVYESTIAFEQSFPIGANGTN